MSKIVTFDQAERLKELGFDRGVTRYYDTQEQINLCVFFDDECKVSVEDVAENSNGWMKIYTNGLHHAKAYLRMDGFSFKRKPNTQQLKSGTR